MDSRRFGVTKSGLFRATKPAKRITLHATGGVHRLDAFKLREYDEYIDLLNSMLTTRFGNDSVVNNVCRG